MECSTCGFNAKSGAGLASHRRAKHPQVEGGGQNSAAVEITLAELDRMGRLEKVDEAKVQAVRSMAAALDDNPYNSQMWREYGEAIERLVADDDDSSAVDELLDELSAPVRDPEAA